MSQTPFEKQKIEELLEQLAELEHDQWWKWAKTLMEKENLSPDRIARWKKDMVPYAELPEDVKEYDRKWARRVLDILQTALREQREMIEKENKVTGDTSDGYHTFNELYEFRKVYNAALFNEWYKQKKYLVHKSTKHNDGEDCFGGGWFIVMATLPTGQISNHYEMKDWDLFQCEEREKADLWDGHTAQDVVTRLKSLTPQEGEVEKKNKSMKTNTMIFTELKDCGCKRCATIKALISKKTKNKYCPEGLHERYDIHGHKCSCCTALNRQREDMVAKVQDHLHSRLSNCSIHRTGSAPFRACREYNNSLLIVINKLAQSLTEGDGEEKKG